MLSGLSVFIYISYLLPLIVSAWYIWLFFRRRRQGQRLAIYPVFILLAPLLFLVIWFLLVIVIGNIFFSVENISSVYQELTEKILIFWLPILFLLGMPLVALIFAVINIRKRQCWASSVLIIAFIYGLFFTTSFIYPSIPISNIRDALVYLSKRLIVPKRVELEFTPTLVDNKFRTALRLYIGLGSGCNTGGTPLIIEIQSQVKNVDINILGHKFFVPQGPCTAIISSNAMIIIQDLWFTERNEIEINFVLGGKRNSYYLKKVEEKPGLFKFLLKPIKAPNVISGKFGYNPPSEAIPIESYINLSEYNRKRYEKATKTLDWKFCKEIIDNKYQMSDCIEKVALTLSDWTICQQDPDQTYRGFCINKFIPAITDPSECKKFPNPSNMECYRALAIRSKNVDLCLLIDYQEGIDWCLIQYVIKYKDKSICERVVDEPNDIQNKKLCLWHANP